MNRSTHVRRFVAATAALSFAGLAGATAPALADAPGNNGTVKVAPYGDIDSIPNNTPHVGCTFQLEWYGFDTNAVSTVTFEQQSPTTDGTMSVAGPGTVQLDDDPGNGAGNGGLDGAAAYTLSFTGAPHPQQGYHVKLTINTTESKGADVKHKVFWVEGCVAPTTTPTPTPSTTPTPSATTTPTPTPSASSSPTATAAPSAGAPEVAPAEAEEQAPAQQASPQTEVLGAQASAPAQASAEVPSVINAGAEAAPAEDDRTPWVLGLTALGLLLAASGLVIRRRLG